MIYYSYYALDTGRFTGQGSNVDIDNVIPREGNGVIKGHYNHSTQMVVDGIVINIPADVIKQEQLEQAWSTLRAARTGRLQATDWTQIPDSPVDKEAWAAYRQSLRDLPENTIDPENPNWPIPPS